MQIKVIKAVVGAGKVLLKGALHKIEDDVAKELIDQGYVVKATAKDAKAEEAAAPAGEAPAAAAQ